MLLSVVITSLLLNVNKRRKSYFHLIKFSSGTFLWFKNDLVGSFQAEAGHYTRNNFPYIYFFSTKFTSRNL